MKFPIAQPDIVFTLIRDYRDADFSKEYVGYFEVPQEEAKEIAQYIDLLERYIHGLDEKT